MTTKLKLEHVMQYAKQHFLVKQKSYQFRFYELSEGLVVPVKIKNRKADILCDDHCMTLINQVVAGLKTNETIIETFSGLEMLSLTYPNCKTLFKSLSVSPEMRYDGKIKTIALKSDPEPAFHRLDFDLTDNPEPSPAWDMLLNNFTNSDAIRLFIGSLFVDDSDRSQYLWLYGKGGNGKSSLAEIFSHALGKFVRFEQAPSKDDKYWTYGLIGKRLIVLDDCNKYGFVKTGLFKTLTGSSKVRVERKFADPCDTDLTCKFLFTSNEKPAISEEISDQRRIIFCSAKNQEQFTYDKEFKQRLRGELSVFLQSCINLFMEHCPDGRPIPSDPSEALEIASECDELVAAWVGNHFEFDDAGSVTVGHFRSVLEQTGRNLDPRNVYKYLEAQGVERRPVWVDGKVVKHLPGLRKKSW